jgi:sulfatase modifying factor 1
VRFFSVCILFLWGLALSGAEPVRTWTDLKGRKMEASFIMYSGDKILIKRADGKSFTLSPALFSAQDQKYLADLKKAVEAPNQTNAKGSTDNEYFKGATIVVSIKGEVSIDDPSKASGGTYVDGKYSSEANAQEGDILSPGSQIKVGANSEIILLFSNGTITTLGANTQMTVRKFLQKGFEESDKKVADLQEEVSSSTLLLDLQIGDLVVDVKKLKKESNFEITSPLGVAGIRGTSFSLSASADSTKLSVLTGLVGFASNNKKQNQVGTEKGLVSSREKEPVINDLADAQKQSIAQTVARAKKEAEEISLSTLRDKLGKSFKTHLVPSAGNLEMIWVESGKFMMGDPVKQHRVTLTKGFYLGKYEVTQAQWKRVMGGDPSAFKGANLPVERVSWTEAVEFCRMLTEMEKKARRLPPRMAYQLPTEAQWEYACRSGTTTVYSWGDTITKTNANYDASGFKQTRDVGQYAANPWGFHDMHGNVYEWCADWYGGYPKVRLIDPIGPTKGSLRVTRGGSWGNGGSYLRSAKRIYYTPSIRDPNLGFRVGFQKQ